MHSALHLNRASSCQCVRGYRDHRYTASVQRVQHACTDEPLPNRKTADHNVVGGEVLLLQLDSNQQPFD